MAEIQSLHLQAASEMARIHDRIEQDRQILNTVKAATIISIYEESRVWWPATTRGDLVQLPMHCPVLISDHCMDDVGRI